MSDKKLLEQKTNYSTSVEDEEIHFWTRLRYTFDLVFSKFGLGPISLVVY